MTKRPLKLRLTLIDPPDGHLYSLQGAEGAPVSAVRSTGKTLSLDLEVGVDEGPNGLRWLGPFIRREGPRRFVYFATGVYAGDCTVPDGRRGKVWLDAITPELVEAAITAGAPLEARIQGADKHGLPACASVPIIGGWRVAEG